MKRLLALLLVTLTAYTSWAGLSTGPAGTNFNSIIINNSEVEVSPTEIDGLNHALASLAVSTNKMYAGGGKIKLGHGVHYITYPFVYTNEWPAAIQIVGEEIPGVNVVYVGPPTNVNVFQFLGNHAHDGVLLQSKVSGVGFASIYDTTNWLVQVQEGGWLHFEGCQFVYWPVATNNDQRGIAVSESLLYPKATNMGGLLLYPNDTGADVTVERCYFRGLQNGVYDGTDHVRVKGCYFSLCGSSSAVNDWPTNSIFRLGSGYIRGSGVIAETLLSDCHFTLNNIAILDTNVTSYGTAVNKLCVNSRIEHNNYRYVTIGNVSNSFAFVNTENFDPDATASIVGGTLTINSGGQPPVKSLGEDDDIEINGLVMYPSRTHGFYVNAFGNSTLTGTNTARAFNQSTNFDRIVWTVTGGETEVNGTYVFKYRDETIAPFFTVWTNTVSTRTNLLVSDPTTSAVVPWGILTVTNHVLDENILYYNEEPAAIIPSPTWTQLNGTSNSITVTAAYGRFSVDADGATSATSYTGSGAGLTNSITAIQTNFITGHFYTNNSTHALEPSVTACVFYGTNLQSAFLTLYIDTAGGRSLTSRSNRVGIVVNMPITAFGFGATSNNYVLEGFVPPGASYCFSNTSSGSGAAAAPIPGTGILKTLP